MFVIGHRGAAGHAPENTIESIDCAIEMGVDYIEIDVQPTRDGRLVVFHDRTMRRLTGLHGYVREYTFVELAEKANLSNRQKIPSFEEVCDLVSKSNVGLFVEIKSPGIESIILKTLRKYFDISSCLMGSFYHRSILKLKQIDPTVKTIALMVGVPLTTRNIVRDSQCNYLGLGIGSLDEQQIQEVRSEGCGVIVWTVDEADELPLLCELGIDGVVSNFPDKIIKALNCE
ncbi:MAG: glycerophosphodiester phosphodiesterase family protein [Desulfobacterales bacterium]|jgi:glycerophosphoryl diester phosphodiesterase